MPNSKSREVDELDDSIVAGLLAQDAANYALRYSTHGLDALKPQKSFASQPKPNTQFLRQIIKSTDSHNAALLAKEAAESRAQLERLETPESQRQRRLNSGPRDISKRQFGEINAILSGRKPTYTDHSLKSEKKNIEKVESSRSSKRRYDDSIFNDRRSRHHHHCESDDDRAHKRRRSTSQDCSRERNHRHSRSSSRSPSRSRSRERHDKTTKLSRSSHSHCRRDRSCDRPVRQRSYLPHRSRRKYRKRQEERQKEDWREKEGKECREWGSNRKRENETVRSREDNSSEDGEYGPISAGDRKEKEKKATGGCGQVKLRGRGAVSEVSGIDRRFDADYDPRADTSGTSEKALRKTMAINNVKKDARGSGWDSAVDAYQLWHKTKVRLTREEVRAEQEQLLATVQWKKKGEERDWDLGKELPNE